MLHHNDNDNSSQYEYDNNLKHNPLNNAPIPGPQKNCGNSFADYQHQECYTRISLYRLRRRLTASATKCSGASTALSQM